MWLQDCEDDGETHAGGRVMHLLQVSIRMLAYNHDGPSAQQVARRMILRNFHFYGEGARSHQLLVQWGCMGIVL